MHKVNIRHCAKCLTYPTTPKCYSFLFKDMETEAQSKKEAAHLAEPAGGKAERQVGRQSGRLGARPSPWDGPAHSTDTPGTLNLAAPGTHGQGETVGAASSSILPLSRGSSKHPEQDSPGSCVLSCELLVGETQKVQSCSCGKWV